MGLTDLGQQLLTADSLTTYGGLSFTVLVLTNAIKLATGYDPKPLGLFISTVVCLVASFYAGGAVPAQANALASPPDAAAKAVAKPGGVPNPVVPANAAGRPAAAIPVANAPASPPDAAAKAVAKPGGVPNPVVPANAAGRPAAAIPVPLQILLALANACLIYLTAQGATAAGNNVVSGQKRNAAPAPVRAAVHPRE